MSNSTEFRPAMNGLEYVTFRVDGLLFGLDIGQVQEINRHTELTIVPHAPASVRGVMNLRGKVLTIIDLCAVIRQRPLETLDDKHAVIVKSDGDSIAFLVDEIGDVLRATPDAMRPPPPNLSGEEGRFFKSVFKRDDELMIVLDLDEILTSVEQASSERI